MARAIQLAEKPIFSPHPNPRVGCVIFKDGFILGEGFHAFAGGPHAEVNALNSLSGSAEGATAYVTLEPCCYHGKTPPCVEALIAAKVKRVVVAMLDPNPKVSGKGISLLHEAGIEVESGLLQEQAEKLNVGFIKRMKFSKPWVRTKIAMSFDGRTAMLSGESQWITGPDARQNVQLLRARADAILTGSGTVLVDNPKMTVRGIEDSNGKARQPLRVIVDSERKLDRGLEIFQQTGQCLLAVLSSSSKDNFSSNVTVKCYSEKAGHVDLNELLDDLASREINEVHVEAGSRLNGALLSSGLIDEIVVYVAPTIMGSEAKGLFDLPGLSEMKDRVQLSIVDTRIVGRDICFKLRPEY